MFRTYSWFYAQDHSWWCWGLIFNADDLTRISFEGKRLDLMELFWAMPFWLPEISRNEPPDMVLASVYSPKLGYL